MCGIVGYIGDKSAADILMDGLKQLEYRGYDSSGVALMETGKSSTPSPDSPALAGQPATALYNTQLKNFKNETLSGNKIDIYKAEGKLQNLNDILFMNREKIVGATLGIGHIRWATHGAPTVINAHPHTCNCGGVAIVHNGIIENFKELRERLEAQGCVFRSQTDTETVAHLIAKKYAQCKNLTEAVRLATNEIEGAFALCVLHKDLPDTLVITKRNAPLLVGIGEGEFFVASDVPAIIKYTKKAVYLKDDQIATLSREDMQLIDNKNNTIFFTPEILPWEPVALSKMGYKHFMLKEIHEQPGVIRNILSGKLHSIDSEIALDEVKLDKETLKKLTRIQIIACGTSLHAAMVGKYLIETFCDIAVDVEASSEYIYRKTVTNENTLVIGVSQSGETADTLTAIKQAKAKGSHILIITNRPDSAMAREADSLISVNAGIEVSVAATKSYMAQLLCFYLLSLHMAEVKGSLDKSLLTTLKSELMILPQKLEQILVHKEDIQQCAKQYANTKDFIFIARGVNYPTALEGALKLKEISYINATGYPAGELKHGPIAMLDDSMPVLSILMKGTVYDKILSNSEESKARNARMIALTNSTDEKLNSLFDFVIRVPEIQEYLSPLLAIVPLQLLAYYIAEFLGKDVDQPRNLAKSVTVE